LKSIAIILVFAGMLVQSFNKAFIVLDYQLNRDFIAKNLCVNKNRPQMHCNGKCHMMKLMKQDEKKDEENPERKMENKFEVFCPSASYTSFEFYYTVIVINYPVFNENIFSGFQFPFFHPPQA
jgi:hypothetical protein